MKRIIWHWTAGGGKANATDKKHYHIIIERDGRIVRGDHAISDNESTRTPYAAHTRGCNTDSIGLAMAGMRGARERPFWAGEAPLTPEQMQVLVEQTASLCRQFGIPVTRQTVLSHAEVQQTLGIKQHGKWDIAWIPGMSKVGDPVSIGDALRAAVENKIRSGAPKEVYPAPTHPRAPVEAPAPAQRASGGLAALFRAFLSIFRGNA